MAGHISRVLDEDLLPGDDRPPRRHNFMVPAALYDEVAALAQKLHVSWTRMAVLILRGGVREVEEWIEHRGYTVGKTMGLSPELIQALQDGPSSPLFAEAVDRSGMVYTESGGLQFKPSLAAAEAASPGGVETGPGVRMLAELGEDGEWHAPEVPS